MRTVETVVIGGGAMGSSTAWALARHGHSVALIEQFEDGHANGASHGEYRNFNIGYHQPHFVDMLAESWRLWHELEVESGQSLLEIVGLVNHGHNAYTDEIIQAVTNAGFRAEYLDSNEASERWPGLKFDGRVLHYLDSGRVKADESVKAMQKQARALGADVRHNTRAVSLNVIADDEVSVVVETDGVQETITARSAVVTVGAWTQKFLGDKFRLPALTVTQVQPVHFREVDTTLDWPSFTHTRGSDATYDYWYKDIYGLLTPGVGVKVGWHGGGTVVDPDKRTDYVDRAELEALQRYVGEWIPGVDRDHFEQISCTYTSTETEDFVLDRVGPIVIGAGFSGQGFKFTPSVGTALAGLVTGERGVAEAFRINGRASVSTSVR